MDANDLPECVRKLIRPRLALRAERLAATDTLVGVWGGEGIVPLPSVGRNDDEPEHWISVDCRWLSRNGYGVTGCLSVYELPGSPRFVVVTNTQKVDWGNVSSGIPLFGQEERCFPPEEVLDAYLTPAEKDSIGSGGVTPLGNAYLRAAFDAIPVFRTDLVAVLGGWHTSWSDGPPTLPRLRELNERIELAGGPGCLYPHETYRCEPYCLVLLTLRDSEPWIEIWGDDTGELHAVPRIT